MGPQLAAFLSVTLISAVSLLAVLAIGWKPKQSRPVVFALVALAVGALMGDVLLHLLPELLSRPEQAQAAAFHTVLGFLIFFSLEKFIRWRHCHLPAGKGHVHPVASLSLLGDGLHNLVDGMLIAAAYSVDLKLGLATSVAVLAHEVPQELGKVGVLFHAGLSARKVLLFNLASASLAFLGLGLGLLAAGRVGDFSHVVTAITAGGFLYIAGSDLVPELHHETDVRRSLIQLGGILAGLGIMAGIR